MNPRKLLATTVTAVLLTFTANTAVASSPPPAPAANATAPTAPAANPDLVWTPQGVKPLEVKVQQTWGVSCSGTPSAKLAAKPVRTGFARKSVTARNNNIYLSGGTTDLTCGKRDPNGYGYLHIWQGHMNDWNNLAAYTGENWRDVADAGMVASLGSPDYAGSDPARNAMCFSGNISLINKRTGQVVTTQNVRTIVQYQKPNRIITSHPGKC